MNERYNGWRNRDTWLAALWAGNDESTYVIGKVIADSGLSYEVRAYLITGLIMITANDEIDESEVDWESVVASLEG